MDKSIIQETIAWVAPPKEIQVGSDTTQHCERQVSRKSLGVRFLESVLVFGVRRETGKE